MQQPQAEHKLAAILVLSEHIFHSMGTQDLKKFSDYFNNGYIWDWNTTDWFCMKVIGKKLESDYLKYNEANRDWVREVSQWKNAKNFWQKRASLVSFVKVAQFGNKFYKGFKEAKIADAAQIIQYAANQSGNEKRFLNTAVGWLLRELSVLEPKLVEKFVETNANKMTKEGIRYCFQKIKKTEG